MGVHRSGSQCQARHSNLLALGGVHRLLPKPARPLHVRLPEEFIGAAILPDHPAAQALAVRPRGKLNIFSHDLRFSLNYTRYEVYRALVWAGRSCLLDFFARELVANYFFVRCQAFFFVFRLV